MNVLVTLTAQLLGLSRMSSLWRLSEKGCRSRNRKSKTKKCCKYISMQDDFEMKKNDLSCEPFTTGLVVLLDETADSLTWSVQACQVTGTGVYRIIRHQKQIPTKETEVSECVRLPKTITCMTCCWWVFDYCDWVSASASRLSLSPYEASSALSLFL